MKTKKNRIFLIEDDAAIVDVYSTAFKNAGINCEVITLGEEAIRKIKESADSEEGMPDIVLLDLILPDLNGAEVLKAVKTDSRTKDIPVYVLSNQTTIDNDASGQIKPEKFVIKANITPTQLVELVKEKLG